MEQCSLEWTDPSVGGDHRADGEHRQAGHQYHDITPNPAHGMPPTPRSLPQETATPAQSIVAPVAVGLLAGRVGRACPASNCTGQLRACTASKAFHTNQTNIKQICRAAVAQMETNHPQRRGPAGSALRPAGAIVNGSTTKEVAMRPIRTIASLTLGLIAWPWRT